jgi:hypothetical protein
LTYFSKRGKKLTNSVMPEEKVMAIEKSLIYLAATIVIFSS